MVLSQRPPGITNEKPKKFLSRNEKLDKIQNQLSTTTPWITTPKYYMMYN
jgi:hypothetical protein